MSSNSDVVLAQATSEMVVVGSFSVAERLVFSSFSLRTRDNGKRRVCDLQEYVLRFSNQYNFGVAVWKH